MCSDVCSACAVSADVFFFKRLRFLTFFDGLAGAFFDVWPMASMAPEHSSKNAVEFISGVLTVPVAVASSEMRGMTFAMSERTRVEGAGGISTMPVFCSGSSEEVDNSVNVDNVEVVDEIEKRRNSMASSKAFCSLTER